ncbi:acyl carrier protein [Dyadobacter psychrophilus]|uniref:Phosphopantetheine attachment site n=1 Tax=Dyadobacter psychrophilus TaxID=651661 RepID=A0A1T5GK93_9BACT|nr:acyl carrier protein [Dyadobacter psychrophilus]SKC08788.1 Phosphopantetheine attachment site [Dyadobacter psychrophilus]
MNKTYTEISGWIIERIAHHAELESEQIKLDTEIVNFRLDSLLMVNITSELEEWLGMELSPSIFWEMGTIGATTNWILENQEA